MGKPTEESLRKAPPKLRALLARNEYDYTRVSKLINCSKPYVGALVRGEKKMSPDMSAKIEAALETEAPAPAKGKHGGNRKPVTHFGHPLLKELYDKFGSWTVAGKAMGYTGAGLIYHWNSGKAVFTEEAQKRVRDVLEGKPPQHKIVRRLKNRVDQGELGLAIVNVATDQLERVLDVAQAMNAQSVFQKRLSDQSWIIIYRFGSPEDMNAFRFWAENGRAEVVCP